MSLLDRLAGTVPKHRKNGKDSPRYQIVLRYMGEIEAARQRGYSWTQINNGIEEDAVAAGIWNPNDRFIGVEGFYRQIKQEAATA